MSKRRIHKIWIGLAGVGDRPFTVGIFRSVYPPNEFGHNSRMRLYQASLDRVKTINKVAYENGLLSTYPPIAFGRYERNDDG